MFDDLDREIGKIVDIGSGCIITALLAGIVLLVIVFIIAGIVALCTGRF